MRDFTKMEYKENKIAIIGTVGVPARYGGFETLVENLVKYHSKTNHSSILTVWCSSKDSVEKPHEYMSASLRYINLRANGSQSIGYDILSLIQALISRNDTVLILGVSGALFIPFARLLSKTRIITNIDGIEWKRSKWNVFASAFLRLSESIAVKFSHEIIADNVEISKYVQQVYKVKAHTIAYGGDHALDQNNDPININLPEQYSLALCRVEPENNIHLILDAFTTTTENLVFIGNWGSSDYGIQLKRKYEDHPNIHILDPIYDTKILYQIRRRASIYIHGHSAGGTNPALVEMMHFGVPIIAYDCNFNKSSTEHCAIYFDTAESLRDILLNLEVSACSKVGMKMLKIATAKYTWAEIGRKYFALLT